MFPGNTPTRMEMSLTDFLSIVRKWETEGTSVFAYLESITGALLKLRLNGCTVVAQDDRLGIKTHTNQYEVSMSLSSDITFTYAESEVGKPMIEVKAVAWRMILFE